MPSRRNSRSTDPSLTATTLRVIGGSMRGRPIAYLGDARTRPMKDRVREAVFNLLGDAIKGVWAIDLFAGTGALAIEAISRGARRATCVERHFPTARQIEVNAASLGITDQIDIAAGDTFIWALRHNGLSDRRGETPWVVFCSPPYALFEDRRDDMLALLEEIVRQAPAGSQLAVESDDRFDIASAVPGIEWDVRRYSPAVVAIGSIGH